MDHPHPPSADALAGLTEHLLGALDFEPGLRSAWCEVSLEWALHCRSRHCASRSQQVLRTLAPPLTGDLCSTLLRCFMACLGPAALVRAGAGLRGEALSIAHALRRPHPLSGCGSTLW